MKFSSSKIPDVIVIEPRLFTDERGFFLESYRKDVFKANGIDADFIQDNHSRSVKGTLRGLHYQKAPMEQAKLVRVVSGSVFDVAVDIRPRSKTFGQHVTAILSSDNHKMLYIPPGFAHGFLALEEGTHLLYKVTRAYSAEHDHGLRWNDPELGIAWPKLDVPFHLSEKDEKLPSLKEIRS